MFVITKPDVAGVHAVLNEEGELSAVIELRRRSPGATDNAKVRPEHRRADAAISSSFARVLTVV